MSDATEDASPRPWRAEQPGDECRFWTIRNPDGVSVCTAWRESDASLIVDAVNERDRLRDIVRRLLDAIDALYAVAAPGAIVRELAPDRTCLGVPIGKIVAEARAAIGEGGRA